MTASEVFTIQKDNIYAVPVVHYNMEMAACVRLAFETVKPDCVAVELAETMQLRLLHAASRLPDISIVVSYDKLNNPIYYMCEPCDAAFEGLRSALEAQIPAFCIDLDVDFYPDIREHVPDPYSIQRIGLKNYYEAYKKIYLAKTKQVLDLDHQRETYMAKRLKELSLSYDRILFIGGMHHVERVLNLVDQKKFPELEHAERGLVEICTLTEESTREVLAECGWISTQYEELRKEHIESKGMLLPPDRQRLLYQLYKKASEGYVDFTGNPFPGYNLRNLMKFGRNYALLTDRLMPDLFQLLSAAKGCVDHNYAYYVWLNATNYPFRKNVDGLPEYDLTIEDVWGHSKLIKFHMKEKGKKGSFYQRHRKDKQNYRFQPPGPFSICSYPPEDVVVENFGDFLKKKGTQILTEEASRTVPFSSSLEDGIDTKETIRHFYEKKLFVKVHGKPQGGVGSVVMIFDEDRGEEGELFQEKFKWRTTWLGEHQQESDMALYATMPAAKVVGPGISRCEYGGFMMSYPPRRMMDVWSDPDYQDCRSKAEVLLMSAIDYAVKPVVVYVANSPPRSKVKDYARRFGKKVVYIPMGQLSPVLLNKIRVFHVLDGHSKRDIADEYIHD